MADPGEGPGDPPYFYIKLRPEGPKKNFGDRVPPYLSVWVTAPPLCQGLDPALPVSIADILVLGPSRTQRMIGNAFRISLRPDWQIDNVFFKKGESWRVLKSFRRCLAEIFFLPSQELWKPARLTSLQKTRLQSVSIFFKFVYTFLLLYLLCHPYILSTFWADIFVSLNLVAVSTDWILKNFVTQLL